MDAQHLSDLEGMVAVLSEKVAAMEAVDANIIADHVNRQLLNTFDSGDTAWVLASCSLVLMMTVPGLALFYGGLARTKNVLAIIMQCFIITCLITVLWLAFGYSLSFAPVGSLTYENTQVFGNASRFWLSGLGNHHVIYSLLMMIIFMLFYRLEHGARTCSNYSRIGLLCLSIDLCHHHPRIDHWLLC